jgi:hypothetical protein
MGSPQAETPFWMRWENPSALQRIKGGVRALLGLNRGGRNFPVFPDDTFLVSYPRSGNTWTRFLIANLLHPDESISFVNIEEKIPDPLSVTRRQLARVPRPRLIKSHEYFDPRYKKVIYIVRDPRDVVISLYYFQLKKGFISDGYPMDRYVARFVTGDVDIYGAWDENIASWLATRGESKGFLLLKYEDMSSRPEEELSRIASFLGIDRSREQLQRAIQLSSVDRMRQLEKAEADEYKPLRATRRDIPFVRTAISGGWRGNLSANQVSQIETAWGPLMKRLGYSMAASVMDGEGREARLSSARP